MTRTLKFARTGHEGSRTGGRLISAGITAGQVAAILARPFTEATDDPRRLAGESTASMMEKQRAEVRIQRYQNAPDCDVVVTFRGKVMELRCPNYDHAVKWARVECKTYGLDSAFIDER